MCKAFLAPLVYDSPPKVSHADPGLEARDGRQWRPSPDLGLEEWVQGADMETPGCAGCKAIPHP